MVLSCSRSAPHSSEKKKRRYTISLTASVSLRKLEPYVERFLCQYCRKVRGGRRGQMRARVHTRTRVHTREDGDRFGSALPRAAVESLGHRSENTHARTQADGLPRQYGRTEPPGREVNGIDGMRRPLRQRAERRPGFCIGRCAALPKQPHFQDSSRTQARTCRLDLPWRKPAKFGCAMIAQGENTTAEKKKTERREKKQGVPSGPRASFQAERNVAGVLIFARGPTVVEIRRPFSRQRPLERSASRTTIFYFFILWRDSFLPTFRFGFF